MISRYVDVLLLSLLLLTLHAAAEPLRDSTPEQTVLGPGNITSSASDGTPGLEPGTSWDLTSRDDQKKLVRLNSAFAEASFVAWAAGIHEPTEQEAKLYFGAEDDDRPYRARSHIRFTFERAAGLKQGYMAEEYKHVKWEKHDPANVCAEKKVLAYVVQKDRKDDASGIINICPEFWSLGLPLAAELDCKKLTKTPTMFVNKDKPGEVPWLTVSGVILHELFHVYFVGNSFLKVQPPEGSDIIDLPPHSRKDGIGPDNIRKLAEKGYKDTNNEEVKERGSYPIAFSNADNWHWYAIERYIRNRCTEVANDGLLEL